MPTAQTPTAVRWQEPAATSNTNGAPGCRQPAVTSADDTRRLMIACVSCRAALVLGDEAPTAFPGLALVTIGGRPSWQQRDMIRALWKFVLEHSGDRLEVIAEGDLRLSDGVPVPTDLALIELDRVDDLPPDDIPTRQYVAGWPTQPAVPRFSGPSRYAAYTPQAPDGRPCPRGTGVTRATLRPAPDRDAVQTPHIPAGAHAPWLEYVLVFDPDPPARWELHLAALCPAVGTAIAGNINLDDPGDVNAAQRWATAYLEDDTVGELSGQVTEWRPIILGSQPAWVPLFDVTDRDSVPWGDLQPATGSRAGDRTGGHR
jgi:hypothetical protein